MNSMMDNRMVSRVSGKGPAQGQASKMASDLISVSGILYEGEEVQSCPLCTERLMWYHLPENLEILACVNPKCVYPFDDTSPYNIRSRTHGKACIEGAPVPASLPVPSTMNGTNALTDEKVD